MNTDRKLAKATSQYQTQTAKRFLHSKSHQHIKQILSKNLKKKNDEFMSKHLLPKSFVHISLSIISI